MRSIILIGMATGLLAVEAQPAPASLDPASPEFFEQRIRPVLIESCYECHGVKKRYGGLRVNSREAMLEGGFDEGPALIPGDIVNSSLLRSMRFEGDSDLNMPPDERLPPAVIKDFEAWVKAGGPWPAAPAASATAAPAR